MNKLIIGEAGVGKSRYIEENYSSKVQTIITAYTGIAANRLNVPTINSLFIIEYNIDLETFKPKIGAIKKKSELYKDMKLAKTIVIDEAYTMPYDTAMAIKITLEKLMNNGEKWGGKNIVLVGDNAQLPSVSEPFIGSEEFKKLECEIINIPYDPTCSRLNINYRNFCNYFREHIENINIKKYLHYAKDKFSNKPFDYDLKELSGFNVFYTNYDVNVKNNYEIKRLNGQIFTINGKIYKEGCPIMLKKNDHKLGIYNGMIAILEKFNESDNSIDIAYYDSYLDDSGEYKTIKQYKTLSNYTDITPAFALTIHKVQGLTLKNININIKESNFKSKDFIKLLYASLTRVHDFKNIYLKII